MALEQPEYRLVSTVDGVEFRDYQPYWVAECEFPSQADLRAASNRGFQYLFNYISGQNDSASKIAMTTPVQQMPVASGWAISFVVPRQFYSGEVPQPTNPAVRVRKVEGGLFAALRYRGTWDSETFDSHTEQLGDILRSHGVNPTSGFTSAVYNPPMTPGFLRRNEVLVRVASLPAA